MILNGGFEDNTVFPQNHWYWSPSPPQTMLDTNAANAHTGSKSVYFSGVTNGEYSYWSLPAYGWNCSLFLTAGFWAKVVSGLSGTIDFKLFYLGSPGYPHIVQCAISSSSYVWFDVSSLLYVHRTDNITAIVVQLSSYSGVSIQINTDDIYIGSSPIVTADLDNVDPSSQDWVFTDSRYYTFTVNFPKTMFPTGSPSIAQLGFQIPTQNGTCQFAVWSDGITWNYTVAFANADRSLDSLRIKDGSVVSSTSSSYIIAFPIWFTSKCLDTLNLADAIDVYVRLNDTAGADSGWVLGASELFQVYNRGGGATETQILGSAGQIVGGKQFSFYADAGGQGYSDMIFRNLQHIKMLPQITGYAGEEQWTVSGGVDYSLDDGSYLRGWQFDIEVSSVAYTGWLASQDWINMTVQWSFNNTWVKTDNIYMFYYGPVENPGDLIRYRFWIDLWFDKGNASTTGGGRINAYEYPMEDNSAVYFRWLSSSWGVKESVEKESSCIFPLYDNSGIQLSTARIKMVKVWMALAADDPQGNPPHQYVIMDKFDVWDLTLGQIPLEGIQTPAFDETKMPVMQNTGFLGFIFSAITGLFKWISDNLIFGGLGLWPTFVAFLDTIAGWLGLPHGFSNLISWLAQGWGWLVASFGYALILFYNMFLFLAQFMGTMFNVLSQAVASGVSFLQAFLSFMGGAYGVGVNIWTQFGIATWLTLFIVFYPLFLVVMWDEQGTDAVVAHLGMVWGILSWFATFFIMIIRMVLDLIGRIVESIPVAE